MAKIGRISMLVEVDGEPCAIVLPRERMLMLVNLAASLSDNGKLPVQKLGDEYQFEDVEAL